MDLRLTQDQGTPGDGAPENIIEDGGVQKMAIRVAINGFGRIGRNILRAIATHLRSLFLYVRTAILLPLVE